MIDSILSGLGYALDTPGALTRGVLAGKLGERLDPRQLLQHYGMVGDEPDDSLLSAGRDALVGAATDPLTYVGMFAGGGPGASSALARLGPRFGGGAAKLAEAAAAGGRPAEMAADLMKSPSASRLLGEIPGGSGLLDGSNNALSFKTPAGDVLRLTPGSGGVAVPSRAAIPQMAQPTRNVAIDGWRAERVPWVEGVGDRDFFSRSYKDVTGGIRDLGGHPADMHPGNLGRSASGQPLLVDPGAVVQHPRGAALPLAPEMLGDVPLKYRLAGAMGGGSLGAALGGFGGY